jgi:hypothetical protein
MQALYIQARSSHSASSLLNALSGFGATKSIDGEGRCWVEVQIGGDKHAVGVLDAVREHFAGREGDFPLASVIHGDERDYSQHDR